MNTQKRVIARGFFDGVHLGHGALLRRAVQRAAELGVTSAAVTFDSHPQTVIMGQRTPLLTTPNDRAELMRRLYGIKDVIIARFDDALMHMDWQEFVTDFLVKRNGAVHLVVGHDFHFGYMGKGNPEKLQAICKVLGLGCDVISPVTIEGRTVSSTYIRTLIAQGEMERAMDFLGHPHLLTGTVEHGKKLGSRLGFPTANLHIPPGCIVPAFGVYVARFWVDDRCYAAATNIGVRPTVDSDKTVTVESTLLDFDGSLYGKTVRIEFCRFLRPEQKFDTPDALRAQVMEDIQAVRGYFAKYSLTF